MLAQAHNRALSCASARPLQAEIKKKTADATQNKGGGAAGLADRKGGAAGHAKFKCPVCAQAVPDMKVRYAARAMRAPRFDARICCRAGGGGCSMCGGRACRCITNPSTPSCRLSRKSAHLCALRARIWYRVV